MEKILMNIQTMGFLNILIYFLFFCFVAIIFQIFLGIYLQKVRRTQLRNLAGRKRGNFAKQAMGEFQNMGMFASSKAKIQKLIAVSDNPELDASVVVNRQIVTVLAFIPLTLVIAFFSVYLAVGTALIGVVLYVYPVMGLKKNYQEIQEDFEKRFFIFLSDVSMLLKAGVGLHDAMYKVSEQMGGPLGNEVQILLKDLEYRKNKQEVVYADFANRIDLSETAIFCRSIQDALSNGTPLADVFYDTSKMALQSQDARIEDMIEKMQPKATAILALTIFFPMIIIIMLPMMMKVGGI